MPEDCLKPWGPDNPHPLSTRKTELVWEGKYDAYGNRRPVKEASRKKDREAHADLQPPPERDR